jgi:hypothetical protein
MSDLQLVWDEISSDPESLGYAALITTPSVDPEAIHKDPAQQSINQALADKLNALNTGQTMQLSSITNSEIVSAIVPAELALVAPVPAAQVGWVLSLNAIDPFDPTIVEIFKVAFGEGSQTLIALNALRNPTVSRATKIGINDAVSPGLIAMARVKGLSL